MAVGFGLPTANEIISCGSRADHAPAPPPEAAALNRYHSPCHVSLSFIQQDKQLNIH